MEERMRKLFTGTGQGERIDGTRSDDRIYGNGGNDKLIGHRGDDLVDGGKGNDVIFGGEDNDVLIGGDGRDYFMFNQFFSSHADKVKDFDRSDDLIGLDSRVYSALDKGDLSKGEFRQGTQAEDGNDHVIFDAETGRLFYDDDGKGGAKQILLAKIEGDLTLTAADFFVFG
jgi:serralysin